MLSKLKVLVRDSRWFSVDILIDAVGRVFQAVTSSETFGWFRPDYPSKRDMRDAPRQDAQAIEVDLVHREVLTHWAVKQGECQS